METKGYKLYDAESKKFMRSKDVVFYEDKFYNFETGIRELIVRDDDSSEKSNVDHEQQLEAEEQV